MKSIYLNTDEYSECEQSLCGSFAVDEANTTIDAEFTDAQAWFRQNFPGMEEAEDYEFTDWHHHIRMLWVYIYHDAFYSPRLIEFAHGLFERTAGTWFVQFECYSPALESERLPTGAIGTFYVHQDTVVLNETPEWHAYARKLGLLPARRG